MYLNSFHQGILSGVRETREEGSTDAEILEAALKLLGRIVSCVDELDKAARAGGLRHTTRCIDRLTDLATEAYNLLGEK